MPDSCSMRATHICIVPTYLQIHKYFIHVRRDIHLLVTIKDCDEFWYENQLKEHRYICGAQLILNQLVRYFTSWIFKDRQTIWREQRNSRLESSWNADCWIDLQWRNNQRCEAKMQQAIRNPLWRQQHSRIRRRGMLHISIVCKTVLTGKTLQLVGTQESYPIYVWNKIQHHSNINWISSPSSENASAIMYSIISQTSTTPWSGSSRSSGWRTSKWVEYD